MLELIVMAVAVFVVFAVLGAVFFLRKKPGGKHQTYVCAHCGERDCICHSEQDGSQKTT